MEHCNQSIFNVISLPKFCSHEKFHYSIMNIFYIGKERNSNNLIGTRRLKWSNFFLILCISPSTFFLSFRSKSFARSTRIRQRLNRGRKAPHILVISGKIPATPTPPELERWFSRRQNLFIAILVSMREMVLYDFICCFRAND